MFSLYLVSS